MKKILFILFLCLPFAFYCHADLANLNKKGMPIDKEAVADELQQSLANASFIDSLNIYCDLFDLLPKGSREECATKAIELAIKSQNSKIGLDMVRNWANENLKVEEKLQECIDLAMKFPDSDDRKETVCFIRMMRNYCISRYSTTEERLAHLDELVDSAASNPPSDIYRHIEMLHAICTNLTDNSNTLMLTQYIDKWGELLDQLRPEAYMLRNYYYVQASMAYGSSPLSKAKAVKYDWNMLSAIDSMENGSIGIHHKYRDYNAHKYIIYTRILSNYDSLTTFEANNAYKAAMNLVAHDSVAASTNRKSLRPQIFMAMKLRDYDTALPLLKKALESSYNNNIRPDILRMTIECAKAKGDDKTLNYALIEYNKVLESNLTNQTMRNWRELEILYDLNQTKAQFKQKETELNNAMLHRLYISITALSVLLILVFLLWLRSNRLTKKLSLSNAQLAQESERVKSAQVKLSQVSERAQMATKMKTAFIKNLADEVKLPLHNISEYTDLLISESEVAKKPSMKKYADLVLLNSDIVSVLVQDLSILSELDSHSLKMNPSRENVKNLCEMALNSVKHRVKENVELSLDPNAENLPIYIDEKRTLNILWQLLSNSAKFTSKGCIAVSYTVSDDREMVNICVEDTGIGISKKYADTIFDRFVKLDPTMQGAGIGLYLSRQLARMLGGDVTVDCSRRVGVAFIVTLPLKPEFRRTYDDNTQKAETSPNKQLQPA